MRSLFIMAQGSYARILRCLFAVWKNFLKLERYYKILVGEIEKYRRGKSEQRGNKDCLGWRRFRRIEDYELENFRANISRCVNYELVSKGVVSIKENISLR